MEPQEPPVLTPRRYPAKWVIYGKKLLQVLFSAGILLFSHFSINTKLPIMLRDAGIPWPECERLQTFLLIYTISCPIAIHFSTRFFGKITRKSIILALTTIVICTQLLLGAVMLKRTMHGFEVNFRLGIALKSLVFVIITALSLAPQMLHGMYVDAIAPQCTEKVTAYFLSNMGCALIRFFTALPIIIVCTLFGKSEDYAAFFTAFLPLLSINIMAHALEQPPIHPDQLPVRNTDESDNF